MKSVTQFNFTVSLISWTLSKSIHSKGYIKYRLKECIGAYIQK